MSSSVEGDTSLPLRFFLLKGEAQWFCSISYWRAPRL